MLGQEVLVDNHYCYDHNGNRTERQQPVGTTRYTYDSVNQLTKIEYPAYTEQLYYDKAGNRSRRIIEGAMGAAGIVGTVGSGGQVGGMREEYRYDPANHLTEYTRGGETTTFTYDKAGNLTADDRARYTYDLFNRTEKVETFDGHIQINHYDAEGLRSGIEEDGRLVQFIFRGQEVVTQLEEEKGMTRYIRGYDLIASDADCARTYYHYASDELGSITHVVAGEDILNRYEYDAWGNLTLCEETVENRFKFNGQQYDPISQQYYLRARYYNPVIGRFTQEDTYRGDGLNLYAYCRNNPVYYADPSGHSCDNKDTNQKQSGGSESFADQLTQHVADEIAFNQEHGLTTYYDTPQAEAANSRVAQDSQTDTSSNRPSNPEAEGPDIKPRQSGESGSLNEDTFTRYLADGRQVTDVTNLPGSTGIQMSRRLTTDEMTFLTQEYGVEFAQVYRYGNGVNGGGGQYYLYSGTINRVTVPIGNDIMLINHTHPGGTASPSSADKLLLGRYQQLGSPQRSSEIIPIGKENIRFNTTGVIRGE